MLSPNRSFLCGIGLCGMGLSATVSGVALAAEPITNTLVAQRVVRVDGAEHLEPADSFKPGEVLQYTVRYHNAGTGAVHALEATLPIPVGVVLAPGSVQPAGARVSVDGTTFAPMPLMRRVRHADGTAADEIVPVAQIRYVRWDPVELSANGSLTVSARVVLQDNAVAVKN